MKNRKKKMTMKETVRKNSKESLMDLYKLKDRKKKTKKC